MIISWLSQGRQGKSGPYPITGEHLVQNIALFESIFARVRIGRMKPWLRANLGKNHESPDFRSAEETVVEDVSEPRLEATEVLVRMRGSESATPTSCSRPLHQSDSYPVTPGHEWSAKSSRSARGQGLQGSATVSSANGRPHARTDPSLRFLARWRYREYSRFSAEWMHKLPEPSPTRSARADRAVHLRLLRGPKVGRHRRRETEGGGGTIGLGSAAAASGCAPESSDRTVETRGRGEKARRGSTIDPWEERGRTRSSR